jgi:S1-C subfamily serine protease
MCRRLVLTACGLILFVTLEAASPWTLVAQKATSAVVFLEGTTEDGTYAGSCTGAVIDTAKRYILTAAHCDHPKILANGTPARRVYKDQRKDLMILQAYALEGYAAIPLAKQNPYLGEEVASIGYGFGLEKPMFRVSHVANAHIDIEGLSGPFVMVDSGFIPGQSGGPLINAQGEIVAVVQRGSDGLGIGVGVDTIRDKVGRYFQE